MRIANHCANSPSRIVALRRFTQGRSHHLALRHRVSKYAIHLVSIPRNRSMAIAAAGDGPACGAKTCPLPSARCGQSDSGVMLPAVPQPALGSGENANDSS